MVDYQADFQQERHEWMHHPNVITCHTTHSNIVLINLPDKSLLALQLNQLNVQKQILSIIWIFNRLLISKRILLEHSLS